MDTTKKPHGFSLASFLVLMFLGDLTEACSRCPEMSVRKACCKHDFLMRVQFMGAGRDPGFPIHLTLFLINPIKVFYGPEYIRTVQTLYSPESEYYCGYQHTGPLRGDDYLISGLIDDIGLGITKCHFAKPWHEVTAKDKVLLSNLTGRDCKNFCAKG